MTTYHVNAAFCACLQVHLDLVMSRQRELEEELARLGAQQSTRSTLRRRKVRHTMSSMGPIMEVGLADALCIRQGIACAAQLQSRNVNDSICCLYRRSHKSKRHWKSKRHSSWRMPSSCCCTKNVEKPSAKLQAASSMYQS